MSADIHILVVDDNQINRQYFSMAINKFDHRVTLAQSGKEAIEFAKQTVFDLIFMDIRMAEMSGHEAAAHIRRLNAYQHIPIIAISAETLEVENSQVFDGFILKPASPSQLKQVIEKFCHLSNSDTTLKIFDEHKALQHAYEDSTIMHHLITLFLRELPVQIKLLEQAAALADTAKSRDIIHKLRGSCQICGAMVLDNYLHELSQLRHRKHEFISTLEQIKTAATDFIKQFS